MKGGKPFYDRQQAGNVRTKALEDIQLVLADDPVCNEWSDYKKQMLLKLSSNILPRLQEISGTDGKVLKIAFDKSFNE